MSSDKTLTITLDEFIDWLDDNPNFITDFSTWLQAEYTVEAQMNKEEKEQKKAKKPTKK